MPQLTLEVTDAVAEWLAQVAAEQKKSVEQVALEKLASMREQSAERLAERYEKFVSESGLFVEVPEVERGRYQTMSEDRLKELAAKLGKAGPLSDVIIEERGKL